MTVWPLSVPKPQHITARDSGTLIEMTWYAMPSSLHPPSPSILPLSAPFSMKTKRNKVNYGGVSLFGGRGGAEREMNWF